jgi:hypothetical protein
MADSNTVGEPSSSPDGQRARIDRLEQEIESLKASSARDTSGLFGWAKRWGGVLALFVGLVAIPRGVVDVYNIFWSRPHTELVAGESLGLGYDPGVRKLSFTFQVGADNTGTKDDFVRDLKGNLQNESAPEVSPLPFAIPDISCTSHGTKMDLPFPIPRTSSTSFACTLTSQLSKPETGPFAHAGAYRLAMNFSGLTNQSEALNFCFDLPEPTMAEVLDSTKLQSLNFLYPDCQ